MHNHGERQSVICPQVRLRWIAAVSMSVLLSGCAANNALQPTGDCWGTSDYRAVCSDRKPAVAKLVDGERGKRPPRDAGVTLLDYAAASLACGNYDEAQRIYYECIMLTNDLTLGISEGKASLMFDEAIKFWQGEAYERSMMELLHGICLLEMGDYANARVAFDRAIATDVLSVGAVAGLEGTVSKKGFAPNDRYTTKGGSVCQRDFLAAYVLRTLSYLFDGREKRARGSWEQTQAVAQELADAARRVSRPTASTTWTSLDGRYQYPTVYVSPYRSLPHDLQVILDTDFEELKRTNTLAVYASGSRPRKVRTGAMRGQRVKFVHDTYLAPGESVHHAGLLIDGKYAGPMSHCLDLYGQAAGRGPSAKDRAQERKEAIENVGEALQQHGVFGVQYIGMLIQAINQEKADIRQWGLLPNAIHLWFGHVPAGRHRFACVPLGQNLRSTEPAVYGDGVAAPFVQIGEQAWLTMYRTQLNRQPHHPYAARHLRHTVTSVSERKLNVLFFAEVFDEHTRLATMGTPHTYNLLPRRLPEGQK